MWYNLPVMRNMFISYEEIAEVREENKCGVYAALDIIAPWSCKNLRVCGGYHAFESWSDYEMWKKQK